MKDFEIKNNLVIDRIDGYSYKLTSKIDADHLCKRLTQQQKTITELQKLQQQSKETEQKLDRITKNIIQLQLTNGIMTEELKKLQEMI